MNTQNKKKLLIVCAVVLVLAAAAAAYFLWLAPKNQANAPGEENGAPAAAADETFRPQLAPGEAPVGSELLCVQPFDFNHTRHACASLPRNSFHVLYPANTSSVKLLCNGGFSEQT